jgi:hypothetical protein
MSSSDPKMMTATTAIGVKGSDVYTAAGVQDERVALSALLTRGVTSETIKPLIDAIIAKDDLNQLEDLFVLAFQTRDVRGGKGEREAVHGYFLSRLPSRPIRANRPKTRARVSDTKRMSIATSDECRWRLNNQGGVKKV